METSLRPIIAVLVAGQLIAVWWLAGQYDPSNSPAAGPANDPNMMTVWSSDANCGKLWGDKDPDRVIILDGKGIDETGTALNLKFTGKSWQGCGLNWKGWYPKEACDDVSKYKSLTFYIRQVSNFPNADLTIHLKDNLDRADKTLVSSPVTIVGDKLLSRIDSNWRRVIIPLERFTKNKNLDLRFVWQIDFSSSQPSALEFQIDRIGFSTETGPAPKFPTTDRYNASVNVDIDEVGYDISPRIYGVCNLSPEKIALYDIPYARWGGNRSSRYNWQNNADNAGKDWFYKNNSTKTDDPSQAGYVRFLNQLASVNANGYITLPTLGYVSKDGVSYAYSVRKYGKQQATEAGHDDVGNGILADGQEILHNDWNDTSVKSDPTFISDGVKFITGHVKNGRRIWVLDNEPMLWHETHRDVRKNPVTYDELWNMTVKYAEAIRQADPDAQIAGFCSWGWTDLFYSAADKGDDNFASRRDHVSHGSVPIAEWFIKKCGEYKRANGKSLIDIFDFHWYPQAKSEGRTPYDGHGMSPALNSLRMRSTRDLWDPNYEPESWTGSAAGGGPTKLLRRIREWINKHNPGMELCVGEYNFGGADNITGALAQADTFGIFGRERADLAFIWQTPEGTQELAWKLFRNYDRKGGRFGEKSVSAISSHRDLSVYASRRKSDGAHTIVVINKQIGGECDLSIAIPGLKGSMKSYRFDQETDNQVIELSRESRTVENAFKISIPAASATIFVIK